MAYPYINRTKVFHQVIKKDTDKDIAKLSPGDRMIKSSDYVMRLTFEPNNDLTDFNVYISLHSTFPV